MKSSNTSAPRATKPRRSKATGATAAFVYRDNLVKLIDVPDTAANRKWVKTFKTRWKQRLKQIELWLVSYPIRLE